MLLSLLRPGSVTPPVPSGLGSVSLAPAFRRPPLPSCPLALACTGPASESRRSTNPLIRASRRDYHGGQWWLSPQSPAATTAAATTTAATTGSPCTSTATSAIYSRWKQEVSSFVPWHQNRANNRPPSGFFLLQLSYKKSKYERGRLRWLSSVASLPSLVAADVCC